MTCCKKYLLISILSLCSFILLNTRVLAAEPSGSQMTYWTANGQWLLGVGVGVVERNLPSSTTVFNGSPILSPYDHDTFTIRQPSDKAILNIFGGLQWSTFHTWIPYYSLTLHYQEQFQSTIAGQIQQYGLSQFTNYNYSTKISSSIVDFIGKINLVEYKCILPYLSAGVGFAFHRISDYTEQNIFPVDPPRISPGYKRNTHTNFAYALGAGFDVILNKNFWVTLGYEYMNLGNVKSSRGLDTWSNTHLDFGTLRTNTVFGNLTYLF